MKKEEELTTIAQIKTEAMKIDLILEERKKTSAVSTNGSYENGTKPVIINHITEEDQNNVDAIHGNGYKGNYSNNNQQGNRNRPVKCVYCKKTRSFSGEVLHKIFGAQTPKSTKTK